MLTKLNALFSKLSKTLPVFWNLLYTITTNIPTSVVINFRYISYKMFIIQGQNSIPIWDYINPNSVYIVIISIYSVSNCQSWCKIMTAKKIENSSKNRIPRQYRVWIISKKQCNWLAKVKFLFSCGPLSQWCMVQKL